MKKLIFVFFVLCIMQPCFSQDNNDSFFNEYGVMVAPGFSNIVNGGDSWSGTLGFQIGLESQVYKMNENSSFYAGVLFSLQGASYDEGYEYSSGKVTLGYISIPLLYNYKTDFGLYGEAGIQPGFLVSAKDKYNGTSEDYKDFINSFDLGIPVGVGLWIKDKISVGARAVFGLSKINNSDAVNHEENPDDKNFLLLGVVRVKINSK